MHLITFGTDEHMLNESSRQHARLLSYTSLVDTYTALIFSKNTDFRIIEKDNLTLIQIPKKNLIFQLRKAYKFLKTHKKPETVISAQDPFEVGLISYIFARVLGTPLHVQIHTAIHSKIARTESLRARMQYMICRFLIPRITAFRVVSKSIKEFLIQKRVNAEKIFVSPVIENLPMQIRDVSYTGGCVELLCVARFVFFKNLPTLIEAFADFVQMQDAHLTIVGGGPLKNQLLNQIQQLGLQDKITLIDWVQDITTLYTKTHMYIHPSYYEGFGMVIVEAIHFGIPVIVTPDVGSVDYVRPENGYVMKGYMKKDIIDGLQYGITHLLQKKSQDIANSLRIISKQENDLIQKESFEYTLRASAYASK